MAKNKKSRPSFTWKGRSLDNYKNMHQKTAEEKGVLEKFIEAKSLTQAKRILFGGANESN